MDAEENKLFEGVPVQLNLTDYTFESHLGFGSAYKDPETGNIRLVIDLTERASERLEKDLLEILDLKAIGFAGIARKSSQTPKTEGAQDESHQ